MFVRVVVFATIVCLLSALVEAQAPGVAVQPRVRITGSRAYEIPGVLKVDGERVAGNSSMTTDEMTVRVVLPQTGQQLVVLKPGKRFVGRALAVRDRVVAFLIDGQHDPIPIPLDSVGKLEVSDHRSGPHLSRGILVGVVAFYGTAALIFYGRCGLDCSDAIFIPAIASGIATGVIAGRPREAWRTVPASWLLSQFSGTSDAPALPANVPPRLSNPRLQPSAAGVR
jgi:hypothetical protein